MEIRGRNYLLRHTYTDSKGVEVWRLSPDDTSKDWSGHFYIHNDGLIEVQLFKNSSNIRYKTVIAALLQMSKAEQGKGNEQVKVLVSNPMLIRELLKSKNFKIRSLPKTMVKLGTRVFEYC